jgi:transposase
MPRITYPPEYRQRILELARSGRSVSSLAKEFEPAEKTIREWVRQAELEETGAARPDEKDRRIRELLRENAILREEREILKKAAAWFARETESLPKKRSGS